MPVSRPKKCPRGAKLYASAATFHSLYSRANDALGLGPQIYVKGFAKKRAAAKWRRKPPFWAVSGASAKSGSRRKSILGRSSGVCVQVSLGRSVGIGLLRAPVMPKQAFLASETILGPCRCNVAVNDASSRSSVFLRWFLLAIGGLPGGFPPPLAVYAEVFHRAGRLLGRSRRFLGCRMRVAASAERTVSSIGIANRRTRS